MYTRAGVDPSRHPGAINLARALGIPIRLVDGLETRACLVTVPAPMIELRRGMSRAALEFGAAHELPHVELKRYACGDPRLEHVCDSTGVAIIVPREALHVTRMAFGWRRFHDMASLLVTTDLILAMRWGAVFEEPVAFVFNDGRVRRAGPTMEAPDSALRAIARSRGGEGLSAVRVERGVVLLGLG